MKLGISSYTYTWSVGVPGSEPKKPWDELMLVNKAAELGVDCLQIADNLPLHLMDEKRLLALKQRAAEAGIDLEVGARCMTADMLLRYLEIAELLNSPILRFVIDGPDFAPNVEEVTGIVRSAVPELEKRGIRLAIENHDRLQAREFLDIVQGSQSEHVGICLDSVNSMGAGEGIETITTFLAPYTFNLHIKEFIVERHPHMMGFTIEGRPVGQGQLPLAWMLEQLGPRCQSAILESWTPPEETLEKTMAKETDWAVQSIKYLKSNYFQ
ncbi:MAG: sugar phosphate isomerase/epimerase [Bacteroidia bacterium]|nr:MAG: sugar phosphate isomerase/epimerase [Bacteroidia bacterium]